jgi:hypothetical protein
MHSSDWTSDREFCFNASKPKFSSPLLENLISVTTYFNLGRSTKWANVLYGAFGN